MTKHVSKWASGEPPAGTKKTKRRWGRWLLAAMPVALLGTWVAIHRVPWLGSTLADGLRAVIGVENVTKLEDFAYGVQDRVNRFFREDEAPVAYWEVPDHIPTPPPPKVEGCDIPPFAPADVGPPHEKIAAKGDGRWVPITDPGRPDAPLRMVKTLIHPDPVRSWSAVSVVAIDLRQVEIHFVLGTKEPMTETKEGRGFERTGLIPEEHQRNLLAAFNGGFKAQHGHYGVGVGEVPIINPRIRACQIAKQPDGRILIGDGEKRAADREGAVWWRQTPMCMVEGGELHPGLRADKNTLWGATLDGDTVIRRSALGVSADGKTLYSGIGDHVTAGAIAAAMKHVGAVDVAQLDVNWSYPKFVVYDTEKGAPVATKLCDGFEFSQDEYVRQTSPRDFFYLTAKDEKGVEAAVCGASDERETRLDVDRGTSG